MAIRAPDGANNEDSEEEEDSVKSRRKSRKGYQT